ncbi:MAG: hypothetical protein HND48_08780 [Chloroflexi bacterium]|nr:hypothetical protein [Chloroflexota bacterium]
MRAEGRVVVTDEKQTAIDSRIVTEQRAAVEAEAEAGGNPPRPTVVTTYEPVPTAEPHLRYLAEWYKIHYENVKRAFKNRFGRDIIGAFRQLQDDGYIEIVTSAATHAYLPLLGRDSTISAQIHTGESLVSAVIWAAPPQLFGCRNAPIGQRTTRADICALGWRRSSRSRTSRCPLPKLRRSPVDSRLGWRRGTSSAPTGRSSAATLFRLSTTCRSAIRRRFRRIS